MWRLDFIREAWGFVAQTFPLICVTSLDMCVNYDESHIQSKLQINKISRSKAEELGNSH